MVFHMSLSDSKSPQVSRTLISIVAYLNSAAISTLFLISYLSNSFTNSLETVPSTLITIGIIVTYYRYL